MQTGSENQEKISNMGLLIDPVPNSPKKYNENHWQTVKRITNEIVGVKGLNSHEKEGARKVIRAQST